ncbi:MAG: hypothetical protein IJ197_01830 [Bacteroidaceae bacterium]|nr:hypothetical protein [Bacteroidaceae bacterium]
MKRTLITILALLLTIVGTKAEESGDSLKDEKKDAHIIYKIEKRKSDGSTIIAKDTIYYSQDKNFSKKKFDEAMREAEKRMKQADKQIKEAEKRLEKYRLDTARWKGIAPDSFLRTKEYWDRRLRDLPKRWLDEYEGIDLPKDQRPLIDLSNIKGRWGFEDYYFSGDILHAQARRGDFCINGWNIRSLLPRLSGLLVLKSKKKAAEKIIFSRETQLRNDKRFQPIVRDRGITIYGHQTKDNLLDEVVILLPKDQSPQKEHVCIIQMMGLLRSEDLTAYRQLRAPSPKK